MLSQIVVQLGYDPINLPIRQQTASGIQAHVLLTSRSNPPLAIYGEVFREAAFMATDSALIYALDFVDQFLKVNIHDINYSTYLMRLHNVQDP